MCGLEPLSMGEERSGEGTGEIGALKNHGSKSWQIMQARQSFTKALRAV